MNANRDVYGDRDVEDNDYSNEIMFRKLPTLPMMENNRPTDMGKIEYFFRKNWSIAAKVSLLGLIVLLSILLIIFCALFSAASVQVEEGEQSNKNIQVNYNYPEPVRHTCPVAWIGRGDSCYFFSVVDENWQGAFNTCTHLQSHLLILTSREEMDFLLPLLNGKKYWIGLKKFHTTWLWFDTTPLTFRNWSPTEPNNSGGNEFCVELRSEGWNDINCDLKIPYICKK